MLTDRAIFWRLLVRLFLALLVMLDKGRDGEPDLALPVSNVFEREGRWDLKFRFWRTLLADVGLILALLLVERVPSSLLELDTLSVEFLSDLTFVASDTTELSLLESDLFAALATFRACKVRCSGTCLEFACLLFLSRDAVFDSTELLIEEAARGDFRTPLLVTS